MKTKNTEALEALDRLVLGVYPDDDMTDFYVDQQTIREALTAKEVLPEVIEQVYDVLEGCVGYWTTSNDCMPSQEECKKALELLQPYRGNIIMGVFKDTTFCASPNCKNDCGRQICLLYTSPSPRDGLLSRMPSSA